VPVVSAGWNLADIWERHADRFPDAPAQLQGERRVDWAELDRRADGIATALLGAGCQRGDKVAHYLYNCPEYLESTFAMFKAAVVPVNTNYRYTDDELAYLWDNADVVAVVFHGCFAERCAAMRSRTPRVRTWIWVDDGSAPCPQWAIPYEQAAASATRRVHPPWGRSPDDLYIIYTGGTTGLPKGVMWRQDDLVGGLDMSSRVRLPSAPGWEEFDARQSKPGPRNLPAAPLMHGTGAFNAMWNMVLGGAIVTTEGRHFDPVELLDTIQRHRVNSMSIVGDVFAKPILQTLDDDPSRWDISSLRVIISSGVIWSASTKARLLAYNERLIMVDTLGSSEALGMAADTTTAGSVGSGPTRFRLGPDTKVLTDDLREVLPGSREIGRVAQRGRAPLGYYKDAEKSASTFVEFAGSRWTIPGDHATVNSDGTLQLLGRGSQCINTGGEKVYPEEVEEALKHHPSVADAAVLGMPDERFGEAVTALVEPAAAAVDPTADAAVDATIDEAQLIAHVRSTLAGYKAPKRVLAVDSVGRAANGKLDYRRLRAIAEEMIGGPAPPAGVREDVGR
jgi:3-oxocholest-4-en-26-oate---CoA ligase